MSSNIEVKLDVLNQKASPALYAAPLADRPAASFTGRLFVDSDSPSTGLYRDTGSAWVQIADAGAGTTGTLQQVTTNGNTTSIGISVTANGIGIGTTIPATNRLDIHAASGIQATFNGTGTTNAALQLQSAGVGKWTIQNNYNSAANDFVLTDVLNTVNRLVIKNTGLATYTGFLNVANIASAQNIQISGTAPAYTIIEGTGNANTVSIGVASIANNFINGSVEGDFCLVSQSTVAKRILLGVQSANSSAICISAANNILLNTTTDNGNKLNVNGSTYISGSLGVIGDTQMNTNAAILGYVNIGTASIAVPNTKLQVYNFGESRTQFHGYNTADGVFATLAFSNTNDIVGGYVTASIAAHRKDYDNGGELVFSTALSSNSPTERMRLKSNGILDVIGSIQIGNSVAAGVAVSSTHKVSILIGGVQYYLLASNI